jgi:hypothetical protein
MDDFHKKANEAHDQEPNASCSRYSCKFCEEKRKKTRISEAKGKSISCTFVIRLGAFLDQMR